MSHSPVSSSQLSQIAEAERSGDIDIAKLFMELGISPATVFNAVSKLRGQGRPDPATPRP